MTLQEMAPWYTTGINKFLIDQKRLEPSVVFSMTDFNLDGTSACTRQPTDTPESADANLLITYT